MKYENVHSFTNFNESPLNEICNTFSGEKQSCEHSIATLAFNIIQFVSRCSSEGEDVAWHVYSVIER